jgi:predicted amidohydrolase
MSFKAACIQLNSGPDIGLNLDLASQLIRDAAGQGAQFIATPENTCHMRHPAEEKLRSALPEECNKALAAFSMLAKELGVWLEVGSLSILIEKENRIANRCYVIQPDGNIAARYDKIHMFDVDLPTGESHRESNLVRPGEKLVTVETPFAKLGLTICYDLRFAYLYRALAQAGANLITVPAAFTVPTGRAHWHILLRARAIETGAFIMAPAQCGTHEGGRATYGHSLIVGPWGDVLAEGGEEPGIIVAEIDMDASAKARSAIPALAHDRDFTR